MKFCLIILAPFQIYTNCKLFDVFTEPIIFGFDQIYRKVIYTIQINGRPIYISSIYMFVYFSVYLSQLLTCIEFEMGMASSLQ